EEKETPKTVAAVPPVPEKATPPKPVVVPKAVVKPRPKPKPKPRPAPRKVVPLVPVMLRSSPSGARIYIDGRLKGTTPTTLMLSTGAHGIRASLPGYQDARRRISIAETMEYPLVFKLKAVGQP
uniref:PEGA domain-containing protein n=1 Tax=Desulfosarcina cetonica TaxID=90730 RepID=UPI0012EE5CA7